MPVYTHLFFDLDGTLWDFRHNTRETLQDILQREGFREYALDFPRFEQVYHMYNDKLWEEYRNGKIEKETLRWYRFYLTLKDLGLDNRELAEELDQYYIEETPKKKGLIPHSIEVLEYLRGKGYAMYIVTNGFNEVQFTKIRNSGLEGYFSGMITSEMTGYQKPHPGFFDHVLKVSGAQAENSLVIGDSPEADIRGALTAGIHCIYFDPEGQGSEPPATYTIQSLSELREIL